jgi:hypothetical protein
MSWDSLEAEARHLVELNQSEVRSITRSYVFPDPAGETIRVVHVDTNAFPEESVTPIEFSPDPKYRLFHPMFVAIVDSKGPEHLTLPEGWGSWSDALVIERAKRRAVG